jgi:hypothetical protein
MNLHFAGLLSHGADIDAALNEDAISISLEHRRKEPVQPFVARPSTVGLQLGFENPLKDVAQWLSATRVVRRTRYRPGEFGSLQDLVLGHARVRLTISPFTGERTTEPSVEGIRPLQRPVRRRPGGPRT